MLPIFNGIFYFWFKKNVKFILLLGQIINWYFIVYLYFSKDLTHIFATNVFLYVWRSHNLFKCSYTTEAYFLQKQAQQNFKKHRKARIKKAPYTTTKTLTIRRKSFMKDNLPIVQDLLLIQVTLYTQQKIYKVKIYLNIGYLRKLVNMSRKLLYKNLQF